MAGRRLTRLHRRAARREAAAAHKQQQADACPVTVTAGLDACDHAETCPHLDLCRAVVKS